MKQNDEIEDLFASTFDDFSVEPPPNVKINIDTKIKKNRFNKSWLFIPVLIALVSVIGYLFTPSAKPSIQHSASIPFTNKRSSQNFEKENDQNYTSQNNTSASLDTATKNSNIKTKGQNQENKSINKYTTNTTTKQLTQTTLTNFSKNSKTSNQYNSTKKSKSDLKKKNSSNSSNSSNQTINNSIPTDQTTTSLNASQTGNTQNGNSSNHSNNQNNSTGNNTQNSSKDSIIDRETKDNLTLKADSIAKSDSLNNLVNIAPDNTQKPPIDSTKNASKWLISTHFGSSLTHTTSSNKNFSYTENNSLFMNIEASYYLNNKVNFNSGIQYNSFSNHLIYNTYTYQDSIQTGFDSTMVINPQDSTVSWNVYPVYQIDSLLVSNNQFYNQSSISIPLYIGYTQQLKTNWYFDATGGILLSYQQAKKISSDPLVPDPTIRSMGIKVCVRPQIRYQLNQFGISISSNFGYDLIPTLNWNGVNKKRMYSEFAIGVHYQF